MRVGGGSGTWGHGTHFKCGPVAGTVAQNYRFLPGTLLLKRTAGRQLRSLGVICRWPDQSLGHCRKAYAQLHLKAVRCLGSDESVHALQIRGFPEPVVWKSHGLKKIKGYGPELLKNLGHCLRRPLETYLFDTKSPLRMSSSPFPEAVTGCASLTANVGKVPYLHTVFVPPISLHLTFWTFLYLRACPSC